MSFALWLRRIRLVSGVVLMAFVACHLLQLALGLFSLHTIESYLWLLTFPWETPFAETLLLGSLIVHALLGLQAIAARRSFAMSTTDIVQLLLALAVPPLLLAHILLTRIAAVFAPEFFATYGLVLALYWYFAPVYALQQLFAVIVVWIHGAIGLYSRLVLLPAWRRVGGLVLPVLFAVPILALLGFVNAGKEVLHKIAEEPQWRQEIQNGVDKVQSLRPQLDRVEVVVLACYGAAVALAVLILLARAGLGLRNRVQIAYDDERVAEGRRGLTILEISQLNGVPHAHVCSGRGRCGTCRVEIVGGAGQLSPVTEVERRTLAAVHAGKDVRLACQAHVRGPGVRVRRLLPAFADASAARDPDEWLPEASLPAQEAAS